MKVPNNKQSVVLVTTSSKNVGAICERIAYDSVASLEPDLGLEGVLTNRTNHLEWDIWTVEESSIIW